jgi:hypothetical protein
MAPFPVLRRPTASSIPQCDRDPTADRWWRWRPRILGAFLASRHHLPQVLQRERDKSRQSPRDRPFCPNFGTRPGPAASADRSVPRLLPLGPPSPGMHPASGYYSPDARSAPPDAYPWEPARHPDPKSGSDKRQGQSSAGQTPALTDPRKCLPGRPTRAGCAPGQGRRSAVPAPGRGDGSTRRCPAWIDSRQSPSCSQTSAEGRPRDMSTIGRRCTFPTKVRAGADSGEPGPRRQPGPRS